MENDTHRTYPDDEIDLTRLLIPLLRNLKLLVLIPLVGAILFGALYYFFAPRKYMSAADLVVMPPKFKTEFQETSPNVQYYKTLIESPALLASVERELVEKKILAGNDRLEIGKQIEDSVFTKKRAEEVTLSPIIRLAAYGKSPNIAFTILNTWIRHINDTVQRLNEKGKNQAISFIDREFPKQRTQYEQASKNLEDDKAGFLNSSNQLEQERKTKLDTFDSDTMKLTNAFDAKRQKMRIALESNQKQFRRKLETERKQLRNELVAKLEPELIKAEYKSVLLQYSDFRSTLKTIDVKIGSEEEIILGLLDQKKNIPKTQQLKKKTLFVSSVSEIPNPDYEKVQERILEHRLKLSSLKAEKKNILLHQKTLNQQFSDLRSRTNENEKQIHAFDVETANELATADDKTTMKLKEFDLSTAMFRNQLSNEREHKRLKLANGFKEAKEGLNGKQTVALSIAESQKEYMENLYKMLGDKSGQARLAKAEDEVSLKVATKPFRPVHGQSRGTVKKTIIVGLLLGMLCILGIYAREFYIQIKPELSD